MSVIDVRRWDGSLVTSLDQETVDPGDFSTLLNFVYDSNGLPVTRGGRRKWNPSALQESAADVRFRSLYHYRRGWLGIRPDSWVVAYAGTGIYKSEQDGVWDNIMTGLESNLTVSFDTLRGWLIMASDSSKHPKPYYWDGVSDSMRRLTNAPDGYIVASHAGRLWIADRDRPSYLWFSAPYEPNTWPGTSGDNGSGFLAVGPGDGNNISALVPGFAGEMIIFKDGPNGGSTYRLQGFTPTTFNLSPLSSTIGAVGPRSATLVGDRDILFGSRRGLHSLNRTFQHGDLESAFIDSEIADRWRSLSLKQKLNAVAVDDFANDTWWLFLDLNSDGKNDRGVLFNYRHQNKRGNYKVSEVDFGVDAASMFERRKGGKDQLMTGGTAYSYLENNPEPNDDGTEFSWTANLHPIDGGDSLTMKAWQSWWLVYDNWGHRNATVTWFGDNRPPSTALVSLNPSSVPVPFLGGYKTTENRMTPGILRSSNLVHLREGGVSINLGLSGTGGRVRLRGMRLNVSPGREDVQANQWMPYDESRRAAVYE